MLRILHHLDVQIYLANETVYTIELVSCIFHRHQHKWMVQFQKGRRVGSLKKWDDDESSQLAIEFIYNIDCPYLDIEHIWHMI